MQKLKKRICSESHPSSDTVSWRGLQQPAPSQERALWQCGLPLAQCAGLSGRPGPQCSWEVLGTVESISRFVTDQLLASPGGFHSLVY